MDKIKLKILLWIEFKAYGLHYFFDRIARKCKGLRWDIEDSQKKS